MNTNTKSTRSANANENAIFSEIAKYRLIIEQAKQELETLETEIKDAMAADGVEQITGNEHKTTFKQVKTNRFDSKAFKLDDPATYEKYTRETVSNRFNFS